MTGMRPPLPLFRHSGAPEALLWIRTDFVRIRILVLMSIRIRMQILLRIRTGSEYIRIRILPKFFKSKFQSLTRCENAIFDIEVLLSANFKVNITVLRGKIKFSKHEKSSLTL